MEKVAVIGASEKPDRYSYKAMKFLEEKGHEPIPVAPGKQEISGKKAYPRVEDVPEQLDTVTMYVGPSRQEEIIKGIVKKKPKRVIFNPGTENKAVYKVLQDAGIEVVEACTLVLLRTNQY